MISVIILAQCAMPQIDRIETECETLASKKPKSLGQLYMFFNACQCIKKSSDGTGTRIQCLEDFFIIPLGRSSQVHRIPETQADGEFGRHFEKNSPSLRQVFIEVLGQQCVHVEYCVSRFFCIKTAV